MFYMQNTARKVLPPAQRKEDIYSQVFIFIFGNKEIMNYSRINKYLKVQKKIIKVIMSLHAKTKVPTA